MTVVTPSRFAFITHVWPPFKKPSFSYLSCSVFSPFLLAGPYRLTDDIEVQATPGHTLSCVTVLVAKSNLDERRPVAIAGDLFERQQDIEDERLWLEAGSEDPRAQRIHRARIANLAAWIIPGHGGPFQVDASVREKLNKQQDQAEPSTEGDVI